MINIYIYILKKRKKEVICNTESFELIGLKKEVS